MSKLDHTLAATWTQGTAAGDKTITGCVANQPVFIIHHVTKDQGGQSGQYCVLRVKSGAQNAQSVGQHYILGTKNADGYPHSTNVLMIMPTATSVVVNLYSKLDDEELLIYKT